MQGKLKLTKGKFGVNSGSIQGEFRMGKLGVSLE